MPLPHNEEPLTRYARSFLLTDMKVNLKFGFESTRRAVEHVEIDQTAIPLSALHPVFAASASFSVEPIKYIPIG